MPGWAFKAWGAVWLVVVSLSFLLPQFKAAVGSHNTITLMLFVGIALLMIIYRLPPPLRVSFLIPTTNTTIEIIFGDLFKQNGHWAIAVNEFFDGQLGQFVSPNSVQGLFIQNSLGSDLARFEREVDTQLLHEKSID